MDYLKIGIERPNIREIKAIQFGVASPAEIIGDSVCDVSKTNIKEKKNGFQSKGSIYDKKMGIVENHSVCDTCANGPIECPGHFGKIQLCETIINPKFIKQVLLILKCVCHNCSRLFVSQEEAALLGLNKKNPKDRISFFVEESAKYEWCEFCSAEHPDYKIKELSIRKKIDNKEIDMIPKDIYNIFLKISNEDFSLLGFNQFLLNDEKYKDKNIMIEGGLTHRHQMRPEYFLLTELPVLPTIARPYIIRSGKQNDDDITAKYIEISKSNNKLLNPKANKKRNLENENKKNSSEIQFHIASLFDNKNGKAKISGNKKCHGFRDRIDGKQGLMRQNIQGKRVDFSSRCVISPSPFTYVNTMTIPEKVAQILTIPVFVNNFNINEVQELINNNKINNLNRQGKKIVIYDPKSNKISEFSDQFYELEKGHIKVKFGDVVERQLQKDDYVLLNRQPTLRIEGMMGFKVLIAKENVFRINICPSTPFGFDHDGDEMNIHVPQNLLARAELETIMNVEKHILTPQKNGPCMGLVQDTLLGAYTLTQPSTYVSIALAGDCLSTIKNFNFSEFLTRAKKYYPEYIANNRFKKPIPGKLLFSALFPSSFSYKRKIEEGLVNIKKGIIKPNSAPLNKDCLGPKNLAIHHYLYIEHGSEECLNFLSHAQFVIYKWQHTIGFSVGIEDCFIHNYDRVADTLIKTNIECQEKIDIGGDNLELEINGILNCALSNVLKISKEGINKGDDNAFVVMYKSGAKGTPVNCSQITGFIGQQNVDAKRIPKTITGNRRVLPYYSIDDDTPNSRGFVSRSYFDGVSPQEYFFNSMGGREGIIATAMGTATTGYVQRRIGKKMEDLKVLFDGTVRNNINQVVEFLYGKDGFDPLKIMRVNVEDAKALLLPIDPRRIATMLNSKSLDKKKKLTKKGIENICASLKINNVRSDVVLKTEKRLLEKFRKILEGIEIRTSQYNEFKRVLCHYWTDAQCSAGENVGIIAASSIGEPTTQSSLKNFDPNVKRTTRKITVGIKKIDEILNATKNPKTPSCRIFVESPTSIEFQKRLNKGEDPQKVRAESMRYLRSLRRDIQYSLVSNFIKSSTIKRLDKTIKGSPLEIPKDYQKEWFVDVYEKMFGLSITPSSNPAAAHWLIELELDINKLREFNLTLTEISECIVNINSAEVECIPSPQNLGKIIIYINFDTINKKSKNLETGFKTKLITEENINYFYTRDVIMKEVLGTYVCGIESISNVFFDSLYDDTTKTQTLIIDTQGSNLKKVLALPFSNKIKTTSDDIWDVYHTLGIAAAKKVLNRELWTALCSDGSYIDKRHIELLINSMTYQGIIMPVRRQGIDKNTGVMAKCSFEQTLENFVQAAAIGERDDLNSISSRVVVGRLINSGTGFCSLVPDYEKAKEAKQVATPAATPRLESKHVSGRRENVREAEKDEKEQDIPKVKTDKDKFLEKLEKWL